MKGRSSRNRLNSHAMPENLINRQIPMPILGLSHCPDSGISAANSGKNHLYWAKG